MPGIRQRIAKWAATEFTRAGTTSPTGVGGRARGVTVREPPWVRHSPLSSKTFKNSRGLPAGVNAAGSLRVDLGGLPLTPLEPSR